MGRLAGVLGMLSGPIEYCKNDGVLVRRSIVEAARAAGLRIDWLNPTDKPSGFAQEIGEEKRVLDALVERSDWDGLASICRDLVRQDERMVDACDFLVAYVDMSIRMCGTFDEISRAQHQGKPVYLIIRGGKRSCPRWLFGKVNHRDMFEDIEEFVSHLADLDHGKVALDERWILLTRSKTGVQ